MTELALAAKRLLAAGSYLDVFSIDGEPTSQEHRLKQEYRKLARIVHPDNYPGTDEKSLAQETFVRLQRFYEEACKALKAGRFGMAPILVVTTKRYTHKVSNLVSRTDVCNIYSATSHSGTEVGETLFKLARRPADNDLLDAEASVLRQLKGADTDEAFKPFLPALVESLTQRDSGGHHRRANVLEAAVGWFSLEEVAKAYPNGISALDMAWMWRRLLYVMGYAHDQGWVHGAVLPRHILIQPEQHGLVLSEWCYSVNGTAIKAVVRDYRDWYPEEVLAKQVPSPATDIYLAAESMIYLIGGDPISQTFSSQSPRAMRAFLRGCCLPGKLQRPQEAWQLIAEFDELLERLGDPFWPRRFRTFSMPA